VVVVVLDVYYHHIRELVGVPQGRMGYRWVCYELLPDTVLPRVRILAFGYAPATCYV
jgi:hypothetical protein